MIKFYENLQDSEEYLTVALALNQAQLWIRKLTKKALLKWITDSQIPLSASLRLVLARRLYTVSDDEYPFNSPFYWASFSAIGQ